LFNTPEEVFELHPKIRWAAKASERGELAFCEMRPGVVGLTLEEQDRVFMEKGVHIILRLFEQMVSWRGSVDSAVVSFDIFVMYLQRLNDGLLALTFEKDEDSWKTMIEIVNAIRKLI
jgi:hypothetical protein